jgi:hypothetical protein
VGPWRPPCGRRRGRVHRATAVAPRRPLVMGCGATTASACSRIQGVDGGRS